MAAAHPCPSCRAQVDHQGERGEHVRCPQCGASLRFIPMYGDGNLILAAPRPEDEPD